MCGICGWLNLDKQLDSEIFVNMNNIAKHRGPDDEGYLAITSSGYRCMYGEESCQEVKYDGAISDFYAKESAYLFLGHRRLSIIDLSKNGHQPMCSMNERYAITFNGEIYNYIELRDELISLGYKFNTDTDTEVILNSYDAWGEECVKHFNGMWGLAIWDSSEHKLFCSRDRLGAKPFYYYQNEKEFIFSSEIKQLCQNPHVKRVLNEPVMVAQIMWGITDYSEDTLIQDIKSLQGGWNLVITIRRDNDKLFDIKKYQYWDINVNQKENYSEEETFDLLKNAIRIRTRSDAPIGVLLSGGLDSSCIVAEIANYYSEKNVPSKNLNTFTSCYENFKEGNEQNFAQMVNKHCGVTQNFIFPDEEDTYALLEKMVWHLEGDFGFSVIGSFLLLEQCSKKGIKVLLNGQGSDETQFGYERYYAYYFKELLRGCKIIQFIKEFRASVCNSKLTAKMLMQYLVYFSNVNVRKRRCYNRMRRYVNANVKTQFNGDKSLYKHLFPQNMEQLQYNELRGVQLSHILRLDDRLYMANSLESRVPFIDYQYIEEVVKIPEERKIQKGYTKYLLRENFQDLLPTEVIWRKNKMGWPSPKNRWVAKFDSAKIDELFSNAKTVKYFNVTELKKLYESKPTAFPFERFIILELFVRMFDVEVPQ